MRTEHGKIERVLATWAGSAVGRQLVCHRVMEASEAQERGFPGWVDGRLVAALGQRGIRRLYEHQARCAEVTRAGRDVVVATPTASGKTLCYNLPVFQALLADPRARALYLFPTKALARDQVQQARALAGALGGEIGVAVYDGDTPPDRRRAARRRARVLATNPEMLHTGILPHHPAWAELLAGLRYVVIDELHTYRGVFGSHLAHVLGRLQRLAAFHGARPLFIATSATIANPEELATALVGRPVTAVRQSGAPRGERHFLIYNPPLVDPAIGLREGVLKAAARLTRDLVQARVGTLVFCRTRLAVEVLVRQLRDTLAPLREPDDPEPGARVRGYRGGYLPLRRREVERALRKGQTDVVVATSALELGIDIGSLDAVVLAGWPGSRAAAWQRAGRAGRRRGPSLTVLVTSSAPVDQFVAGEPEFFFGQAPEHARINAHNPSILVPHLKCAASELPFAPGEAYRDLPGEDTADVLGCLADASLLHRNAAGGYHYVGEAFPAAEVSLRGPLDENFLVLRQPGGDVLAEVDYEDVPLVLHENAIYQLEGRQYEVLRLDHEARKAHVVEAPVDYFTDAMTQTRVRVLEVAELDGPAAHGEVYVVQRVVGFKKIKLHTRENVGYGDVQLPPRERHTTALWLTVPPAEVPRLGHAAAEVAAAALGMAHALHSVAALILMSDASDLGRAVGDARSGWFAVAGPGGRGPYTTPDDGQAPTAPVIYLFDRYPGGTGLAERLFDERAELIGRTRRAVAGCDCHRGCPACVGPAAGAEAKQLAGLLLGVLESGLGRPREPDRPPAAGPGPRQPTAATP
jgi:DEAD/DEAH box helicase domain-containing protein